MRKKSTEEELIDDNIICLVCKLNEDDDREGTDR